MIGFKFPYWSVICTLHSIVWDSCVLNTEFREFCLSVAGAIHCGCAQSFIFIWTLLIDANAFQCTWQYHNIRHILIIDWCWKLPFKQPLGTAHNLLIEQRVHSSACSLSTERNSSDLLLFFSISVWSTLSSILIASLRPWKTLWPNNTQTITKHTQTHF